MSQASPLLSVRAISKRYGTNVVALKNASFDVFPGTIHALAGANGAGKSTLIKILSGAIDYNDGSVEFAGTSCRWLSPADALGAGIATIYQHIPLAPTLSVLENVFMRSQRPWRKSRHERERLQQLLDEINYEIDPDAIVADLPIGSRQMVCILQALAVDAKLIIMDEPTAPLSDSERRIVFAAMGRLKERRNIAFIFISHFLDEILEICENVTVLRDGETVLNVSRGEIDEKALIAAIVGKGVDIYGNVPSSLDGPRRPVLEVSDLRPANQASALSFNVAAGEIVGIAGLLGSGRSEILHAIFGSDTKATGTVRIDGSTVARTISAGEDAGIVLVPEDRHRQALFPERSIRWNTSLIRVEDVSKFGLLPSHRLEEERAREAMSAFSIKAADPDVQVSHLSGGNAQKVALARALSHRAKLLLLDEPTAGVDIGAKEEIRVAIEALTNRGVGVLVVLSDFEELLSFCHRVLVLHHGRLVAERDARTTSEHELIGLASGLSQQENAHDVRH